MTAPVRPFSTFSLLVLASLLPSITASKSVVTLGYQPSTCTDGCRDALRLASFADHNPTVGFYTGQCTSKLFVTSLAACSNAYCTLKETRAGWETFEEICKDYGKVRLMKFEEALELVPEQVEVVNTLSSTDRKEIWGETILVSLEAFDAGFRTERAWQRQNTLHHAFGWCMYVFLAFLVILGISNRLLATSVRRTPFHRLRTPFQTTTSPSLYTRLNTYTTKYITAPMFFRYKNTSTWGWIRLPNRIQGILVGVYVGLNVLFVFVGYETFDDNLYWRNDQGAQLCRYVADRTGIMAIWNLPLLWLTATRNDILLWVCGWSFADLNLFHRWVGRVATVLAVIHSVAYAWIARSHLARNLAKEYWYCGLIATVSMVLLIPLSIRSIRMAAYEVFLVVHIALALVCLVTMFYHVRIFNGSYDPWLWACVGIWVTERFLRLVRLVLFSWKGLNWSTSNAIITAEDSSEDHLLRLTVSTALTYTPQPGTYYFLYFPSTWSPWENHPFTLSGWSKRADGQTDLHFLVKEQKGATRRLARRTRRAGNRLECRVWVEGPYGRSAPLKEYKNVLMVAGGSGIASALPYLQHFREVFGNDSKHRMLPSSVRLVWIVRSRAYAKRIVERDLQRELPEGTSLEVDVFVTSSADEAQTPLLARLQCDDRVSDGESDQDSVDKERLRQTAVNAHSGVVVRYRSGRPCMDQVLEDSLERISIARGRLAIQTCGPAAMMEDLRAALVRRYGMGKYDVWGSEVDLWEDGFVW
ncbi:ferric reductase like transmembrane component-domain-containing protein [Filobasidium floriforme]|uniref:ferric reductase like transmembrane component-domain-containing protein n=1 Tax=Filobasidium floriforme TaxID=5210 RepID=UPI001E8EC9EF|nr:ferric reductase like transmembrane component-domain-containing protein [Filobasidium floriforme]KAH8085341.1 ferric reductase like transmembrane component-domain-containing protein [Filobasidium floriforme]